MELYSFFNSSASYRVRIALNLKELDTEYIGVNIRNKENLQQDYVEKHNPVGLVPALVDGNLHLGQSLAIIDYLDGKYPERLQLLPQDNLEKRARILEFISLIACEIHPLNNLRVLRYLQNDLKLSEEQKNQWYHHWIKEGLSAAERLLNKYGAGEQWCFGDTPTLADCYLIPQIANAERMKCDLSAYSRLMAITKHALQHPAFIKASPQNQADFIA